MLISVFLLLIYLHTKRWDRKLKKLAPTTKSNKYSKSKIFSIATTSVIMNMYIFSLDVVAVYTHDKKTEIIPEQQLAVIPKIVLGVSSLAMCIWASFWILSFCSFCLENSMQCFKNKEYCYLALSVIGPSFSLAIHLPYIMIAFLNDAYHASSVFIIYIIIAFVLFGAIELNYGTCQGAMISAKYGKLKYDELLINEGIKLTYNSDNGLITTRDRIQGSILNGTDIKVDYSIINQQQVKLKSLKLSQEQEDFLTGLNNNTALMIQFGPDPDDARDDDPILISNNTCTLKSSKLDEESKVRLELSFSEWVNVQHVDLQKHVIILKEENSTITVHGGKLLWQTLHCCPTCTKSELGIRATFIFTIPLFIILLLCLIVLVTAILVIIPINNAFSDAPNRLIGFYQSVLVLIGAYFAYKKFFKKRPSLHSAVNHREKFIRLEEGDNEDDWQQMSKNERVNAFYSKIVDIVANHREYEGIP